MKITSGILLTGGLGSRLGLFTTLNNKHLHPIGDKLILNYSINTIKSMGITDLTIVLGGEHFAQIVNVLKGGEELGLKINYIYQSKPSGIAQAINLCKHLINNDRFAVVLGDNIFQKPIKYNEDGIGCEIFLNNSEDTDLHQFGVISIYNNTVMCFEEKPKILASGMDNFAITGAYVFDQKYFEYYKNIQPSKRGEFEILDIIKQYHSNGELKYNIQEGYWSDSGTPQAISKVLKLIETKQVEWS